MQFIQVADKINGGSTLRAVGESAAIPLTFTELRLIRIALARLADDEAYAESDLATIDALRNHLVEEQVKQHAAADWRQPEKGV